MLLLVLLLLLDICYKSFITIVSLCGIFEFLSENVPCSPTGNMPSKRTLCSAPAVQSRDSIEDIFGELAPYKHQWPARLDQAYDEEPEKWVQSACVLCR